MVRIDVDYEGDLRTVCRHEPSGASIATDAPTDNEGKGEAFSPTDLLAASVGSCMLTVMGIQARRHGWSIDGAHASVEKHMVTAPARRIGRLVVRLDMPAGVPEEAREVLARAARTCPVDRSLHQDVAVEASFHWK